jgi:DNA-binding transcriptional regulator YhcF (GntR family)
MRRSAVVNYNFLDETRKALALAREEAIGLGHEYVGTEHLLLGLCRLDGVVGRFRLDAAAVVERVGQSVRRGNAAIRDGELPYTSRAKKALEFAMAEAREMSHGYIGADHLLLGVLREERGIGAQILTSFGLDLDSARKVVLAQTPPWEADVVRPDREGGLLRRARRAHQAFRIVLDDSSTASIYEQIVERIREAVATGALKSGQKLQPVRRLADELDIAPGTVARAYVELERLGIIMTEGARGTRVADVRRNEPPSDDRKDTLAGLLRPVVVAAFHLGGTADELRDALERAMKGILDGESGAG